MDRGVRGLGWRFHGTPVYETPEGWWLVRPVPETRNIQVRLPETFRIKSAPRHFSSVLSRLKDGKTIGVVDEDPPEESHSQDTIEPLYKRALLGGSAEEGDPGQFE